MVLETARGFCLHSGGKLCSGMNSRAVHCEPNYSQELQTETLEENDCDGAPPKQVRLGVAEFPGTLAVEFWEFKLNLRRVRERESQIGQREDFPICRPNVTRRNPRIENRSVLQEQEDETRSTEKSNGKRLIPRELIHEREF